MPATLSKTSDDEASSPPAAALAPADDEPLLTDEQKEQLSVLNTHLILNMFAAIIPFTQRADMFMAVPRFGGDIAKVAIAMASTTSLSALLEFVLNPTMGTLSDQVGRKFFIALGPAANLLLKGLVFANPQSEGMLTLERILGGALSTVAGTTCTIAGFNDVLADHPTKFAKVCSVFELCEGRAPDREADSVEE